MSASSKKRMTFTPGNDPGNYAAGFAMNDSIRRLVHERLARMGGVPVGNQIAAVFPWMRQISGDFAPGANITLNRDPWAEIFANRMSKGLIKIHEVRIIASNIGGFEGYPAQMDEELQLKMSIPDRRSIFERWMPWKVLQTETDRTLSGYVFQGGWALPAPYFCSRTNPFELDILWDTRWAQQAAGTVLFFAVLHGFDARNGEPLQLVKAVEQFPAELQRAGAFQTISFDDDRDRPIRDMWITDIGFGAAPSTSADEFLFAQIRVRPQAPQGPKWHYQEFYPIEGLVHQVGAAPTLALALRNHVMIHRPVVPYTLYPGEHLDVEARNLGISDTTYTMFFILMGTQEGDE